MCSGFERKDVSGQTAFFTSSSHCRLQHFACTEKYLKDKDSKRIFTLIPHPEPICIFGKTPYSNSESCSIQECFQLTLCCWLIHHKALTCPVHECCKTVVHSPKWNELHSNPPNIRHTFHISTKWSIWGLPHQITKSPSLWLENRRNAPFQNYPVLSRQCGSNG